MTKIKNVLKTYLAALAYDHKKGWPHFFLKLILEVFSWLYLAGLALVKSGYTKGWLKTYQPGCKVISVGNITLGGTGKTPLVIMISSYLQQKGRKIAVLIRGYGPGNLSDEALLLNKNLPDVPVLVGPDRITNLIEAQNKYMVDTVILDDGFQHWKLGRHLDIVTVDGLNPFGNGHLLPRGILREPLSSLKRADIISITFSDSSDKVPDDLYSRMKKINPQALIIKSYREPVFVSKLAEERIFGLSLLNNEEIAMLCGIGNPENFKTTLLKIGAFIKAEFVFPDHHLYTADDLEQIIEVCHSKGIKKVVTTQKDAIKLGWLEDLVRKGNSFSKEEIGLWPRIKDIEILILHIEMKISHEQEEEFNSRLSRLYNN